MINTFINIIKVTVCCILLSTCLFAEGVKSEPEKNVSRGMFSWRSDVFEEGGLELFSFMKKHGFTELYQCFSNELDDTAITDFLLKAQTESIDIYLLTGDPSWANDSGGSKQLEVVEEVVRINKLTAEIGIKGIVFDIEPYTLESWDSNSEKIMGRFISGMKKAYDEASANKLEVVLCIPFYYDNMGLKGNLEKLIKHGCDRIAIMNYFKHKEADNIAREVKYAQRNKKGIINIYEFKSPGEHGLREINTYYSDGFESAISSFNTIKKAYPKSGIIMAAHDYEALKEVLNEHE